MTFPSDAWFDELVAVARGDADTYLRLGFAEFRLVVEVVDGTTARRFGLVLDGYDALYAGELGDPVAFDPDATLTGDASSWGEMIDNILAHGGADLAHTLNALSIADAPLRVVAEDPMGRDKFFRYAETLQTLFDGAAKLRPTPV